MNAPNSTPSISVVIPVWNAADLIGEQLQALTDQTYDGSFEVIVADNMSTDDLPAALEPFRSRLDLRVVPADGRRGVSHARNRGCAASRSPLIAICDADDIVDKGWLGAMARSLAIYDVVGGKLSTELLNVPRVRRWRAFPEDSLRVRLGFLPYPPGGNIGLRRPVFEALDGWDELLVGGGDDADFGWRAQIAGFSLYYDSSAIIHYRLRDSLMTTMRQVYVYAASSAPLVERFAQFGLTVDRSWVRRDVGWLVLRLPYVLMFRSWRQGRWFVRAASLVGRVRGLRGIST